MTASLELILLPLYRQNDRDLGELPGLVATHAPRRSARGRSMESLVLHLALEGTAPLSPKGCNKLVGHLIDLYFKTPGSSTTAMRTVASWLNDYLIERNLRGANRSMQSVGLLTMAVFRGKSLYLAQCGPTHAFLITASGLSHFHESEFSVRGLGLGRATNIRYQQVEVTSGDLLLISADPPPIWTNAMLNGLRGWPLDKVHLRLIHQIGPELQAGLVQIETGSRKVRVLRPAPIQDEPKSTFVDAKTQTTTSLAGESSLVERAPSPKVIDEPIKLPLQKSPVRVETEDPAKISENPPMRVESQVTPLRAESALEVPIQKKPKIQRERIIGPALLKIGEAVGETARQGSHAIRQLVKRMLPDESLLSIPTSVMAFIAVAVPIVVVSIAATVYLQRGQGRRYAENYLEAQYAAEQALQLADATELRTAWKTVLTYLDEAETYQITDDSKAMRAYAMTVLDNLDIVVRLPFQQALIDSLPKDAVINRIVTTDSDNELFLLNETNGHVLWATRKDQGYSIVSDFICEPVPKPLIVGVLVDIIPLPLGDPNNAAIMGMDANGNLMQCIPGGKPPLTFQMPPPDMNWGTPTALEMNSAGLYVLDPVTNAVWIFWANDEFSERPTLFFDDQIPPMGDVIDLTLYRDDLFLLHTDGHLTTCTFGYPTRCEDPAMINDLREGRGNKSTIDDAKFIEIQYAPPPDPSIYLLDSEKPSIYHFSLRLTYQRQYQSQMPFPTGAATAFAVTPNRQVFLAIGNQVFFAPLP